MKFAFLLSPGLAAAAAMVPTSASAQMERHRERVVERTVVHTERHGYAPRVRRVCRTEYRHHRRIRTCRTVRR